MGHICEIASERVRHPSDVLTVGQQVEAAVLRADETDNPNQPQKIALSLRALSKHADGRRSPVSRWDPGQGQGHPDPALRSLCGIGPWDRGSGSRQQVGKRAARHPSHEVLNAGDEAEAVMLGVEPNTPRISPSLDLHRLVTAKRVPQDADYAKTSKWGPSAISCARA
jgi:ribosomal protein S1